MNVKRLFVLALIAIAVVSIFVGCGDDVGPDDPTNPTGFYPILQSSSPANGATDVPVTTSIVVTYDLPINILSVNTTTFVCSAPSHEVVIAAYSADITGMVITATLGPGGYLFSGTTYTCVIGPLMGVNGWQTAMSRISFTTAGSSTGGDIIAPSVVSVTTLNGKNLLAEGVKIELSDTIIVKLSENFDPNHTPTARLWIKDGAEVLSTVYTSADSIYITDSLTYGLTYELVVSGVRDVAGNVMAEYRLEFETLLYAGSFYLVNSSPANGATVSKDEVVWAKFNNPVNISYLTTTNFAIGGAAYTLSLSSDGLTAYATPTATGWPAGSRTISLSNIRDIYGNTMAPVTWSFESTGSSSSSPFTYVSPNQTVAPGTTVSFILNGPTSGVSCVMTSTLAPAQTVLPVVSGSGGVTVSVPTSASAVDFYEVICSTDVGTKRLTVVTTTTPGSSSVLPLRLNVTPGASATFSSFDFLSGTLRVIVLGLERWYIQLWGYVPTITPGYYEAEVSCSGGGSVDYILQNASSTTGYFHYDFKNEGFPCDGTVRIIHFKVSATDLSTSDANARVSGMPCNMGDFIYAYMKWRRL